MFVRSLAVSLCSSVFSSAKRVSVLRLPTAFVSLVSWPAHSFIFGCFTMASIWLLMQCTASAFSSLTQLCCRPVFCVRALVSLCAACNHSASARPCWIAYGKPPKQRDSYWRVFLLTSFILSHQYSYIPIHCHTYLPTYAHLQTLCCQASLIWVCTNSVAVGTFKTFYAACLTHSGSAKTLPVKIIIKNTWLV